LFVRICCGLEEASHEEVPHEKASHHEAFHEGASTLVIGFFAHSIREAFYWCGVDFFGGVFLLRLVLSSGFLQLGIALRSGSARGSSASHWPTVSSTVSYHSQFAGTRFEFCLVVPPTAAYHHEAFHQESFSP
jgi:hypothetical protein